MIEITTTELKVTPSGKAYEKTVYYQGNRIVKVKRQVLTAEEYAVEKARNERIQAAIRKLEELGGPL